MSKNSIILGVLLGICVPIVGFAIVQIIFEQLIIAGLMDGTSASISSRRLRTIALLGICTIIIPFEFCRRKKLDNTLRGMVFPVIGYVLYWLYYFKDSFIF